MKLIWEKRKKIKVFMVILLYLVLTAGAWAEEKKAHTLDEVVVTNKIKDKQISYTPEKTFIDVETYQSVGNVQNIGDIIKDQPIIDFRGASDLVPGDLVNGDDTLWMRGFGSNRFSTAIDGSDLRKSGGRNTLHIVDYSLLPTFLIEKIEILPGPHSALFPAKSIGGVVNLITKSPERHDTLKPDLTISTGYKSYNTQNHSIDVQGSASAFTYDLGSQKYSTDGYLRNAAADINTVFGRIGYILPSDGHIALTVFHTEANREIPVKNDPGLADFDSSRPVVEASSYMEWQNPEWDETATSFRLNFNQATPIGLLDLNAYYSEEKWKKLYLSKNSSGIYDASWETKWHQQGAKLQDTIRFSDNHVTTIGTDLTQCFDGSDIFQVSPASFKDEKRIEIISGFAQHRWQIVPVLTLTAGMRYEDVSIKVDNYCVGTGNMFITGKPRWIERNWNQWLPKSFLTYELDNIAPGLRDTSVSLGVSKIWKAPDWHGDYNPRGMPAGAWMEPEHGMGYDLVLSRRVVNDIQMKVNYAYYEINDYIAWNWDYAKYTPVSGNLVSPGMEYKDYLINLDKVIHHCVELQLSGHLMEDLSFYLGYAYQSFDNKGGEPAGETGLDNQAKHRVNAGLRYDLFKNTLLLLDYKYQDKQIAQKAEEIEPGEWVFTKIPMEAYHVFDFAVQQTFFQNWGMFKNGTIKLYINNLFDADYENLSGYPATDRTYGIALNFDL
ncbi:TonB-dependent receptor, FCYXU motif-type [Desulfobacula phenolica]|nr:TonB-dependent receptor [Desulfobacula phenolica]